jgi:hypothetical protein
MQQAKTAVCCVPGVRILMSCEIAIHNSVFLQGSAKFEELVLLLISMPPDWPRNGRGLGMFIECDDVTAQNGKKALSKPARRAIFLSKVTPNLSYDHFFMRSAP